METSPGNFLKKNSASILGSGPRTGNWATGSKTIAKMRLSRDAYHSYMALSARWKRKRSRIRKTHRTLPNLLHTAKIQGPASVKGNPLYPDLFGSLKKHQRFMEQNR